ncbi:hypothetical protein MMC07_008080, partial [Pseudocyphellaria aurata]|nr:hypothetical protein [Pseudocyphellaria aurata]
AASLRGCVGAWLPASVLEAPVSVLEAQASLLEAPASLLEAPVSVLEAQASVLEAQASVLEAPASVRFCNTFQINRQILTYVVYSLTFGYLILFSIFNTIYLQGNQYFNTIDLQSTPAFEPSQYLRSNYDIKNVSVKHIKVAAIHLTVLFATNNRLNLPKAKRHCELLPIPGASTLFLACAGVDDPDVELSMYVVVTVMLGALPTVAWSRAFRRSTSKVILMFWLLLLAVGHTFYALTITSPRFPFQICPKNNIEPLPTTNFQAPFLDQSWRDSFSSLVSTAQNSSQSPRNSSLSACLYSCFATSGYLGRNTREISVWDGNYAKHPFLKHRPELRLGGTIFWWFYTFLAFLTILTTEGKGRLPNWLHKLLFSIEYCRQPQASKWKWKTVTIIAIKRTKVSTVTTDSSEAPSSNSIHITVLKVLQVLTQLASAGVFCGTIIYQETQNARAWSILSQEPLAAVGQWSNVAVVLLVLVAAGVGRIWAGTGAGSAVVKEGRMLKKGTEGLDKDGIEESDEESQWRMGYAW